MFLATKMFATVFARSKILYWLELIKYGFLGSILQVPLLMVHAMVFT